MKLDPRRLLVLRQIADGGGVAGASRALGHTPSAISQHLSRLESEVGLPLVDRSGGRAELTVAGRMLADYGRRIEELLDEAAGALDTLGSQAAGPIAIGVPLPAITFFAGPALHLLATSHPALEPRLVETGAADGLRALRRGELDVLVMEDDDEQPTELPPGVRSTVMFEDSYKLVLPETWEVPDTLAQLSGIPWIGAAEGTPRDLAFRRLAAEHGIKPSTEHLARERFAVYSMLAVRLGPVVLPANAAGLVTHGTVTEVPVPGRYLLRLLRRTGSTGTVPAAEAAASALQSALLAASERMTRTGMTTLDPRISAHLRDPSEL